MLICGGCCDVDASRSDAAEANRQPDFVIGWFNNPARSQRTLARWAGRARLACSALVVVYVTFRTWLHHVHSQTSDRVHFQCTCAHALHAANERKTSWDVRRALHEGTHLVVTMFVGVPKNHELNLKRDSYAHFGAIQNWLYSLFGNMIKYKLYFQFHQYLRW